MNETRYETRYEKQHLVGKHPKGGHVHVCRNKLEKPNGRHHGLVVIVVEKN
jgi:hypothetical protein